GPHRYAVGQVDHAAEELGERDVVVRPVPGPQLRVGGGLDERGDVGGDPLPLLDGGVEVVEQPVVRHVVAPVAVRAREGRDDVLHQPGVCSDAAAESPAVPGAGGEAAADGVVLAAVFGDHADADQFDGVAVFEELGVVEDAHGHCS